MSQDIKSKLQQAYVLPKIALFLTVEIQLSAFFAILNIYLLMDNAIYQIVIFKKDIHAKLV